MVTEMKIDGPIAAKRNSGLDVLRIVATFAVIVIHTAGYMWEKIDCTTFEWNVLTVYDSLVQFKVPLMKFQSATIALWRNWQC